MSTDGDGQLHARLGLAPGRSTPSSSGSRSTRNRGLRLSSAAIVVRVTADLPLLDVRSSALLRHCVATDRFHVTDFLADGEYPSHRREKDEAEAYVAAALIVLEGPQGAELAEGLEHYVRHMYPPEEVTAAAEVGTLTRLLAFAALQRAVDDALHAIDEASFERPAADDYLYASQAWLLDALDRDGLLPLTADDLDSDLLPEGVIVRRGIALYPHPLLAPLRELVWELFDLVQRPELTVRIALHPHRFSSPEEVPRRLLAGHWSGIKVTPGNLDSLDRHDVANPTFHGADQTHARRFFFPLLGTWFDWDRRDRHDPRDRIKRLYIREVRPATNRTGEPLAAAWNRELHAERDTRLRRFTHVDGKQCSYPAGEYAPSVLKPNARPGKPAVSRKLWRVDGPLDDRDWASLVGRHFRDNELIGEHFADTFPDLGADSGSAQA